MASVSHLLKLIQFLSLFSIRLLSISGLSSSSASSSTSCILARSFSKPSALTFWVYQLLGESGTFYGVHFGKNIPWVSEFPFGVIKDPQYVGSIMSLLACLAWVPSLYILMWVLGYVL